MLRQPVPCLQKQKQLQNWSKFNGLSPSHPCKTRGNRAYTITNDDINEILGFATKNQKKTTIKKKRPPEEDSVKDKLAKRRAMAAKGDPKAYKSGSLDG